VLSRSYWQSTHCSTLVVTFWTSKYAKVNSGTSGATPRMMWPLNPDLRKVPTNLSKTPRLYPVASPITVAVELSPCRSSPVYSSGSDTSTPASVTSLGGVDVSSGCDCGCNSVASSTALTVGGLCSSTVCESGTKADSSLTTTLDSRRLAELSWIIRPIVNIPIPKTTTSGRMLLLCFGFFLRLPLRLLLSLSSVLPQRRIEWFRSHNVQELMPCFNAMLPLAYE